MSTEHEMHPDGVRRLSEAALPVGVAAELFAGLDGDDTPEMAAAADRIGEARDAMREFIRRRAAVLDDSMTPLPARLDRVERLAERQLQRGALAKIDAARRALDAGLSAAEDEIARAMSVGSDAASMIRAGEVRAVLRGLPRAERRQAIREAARSGDAAFAAAAVAGGPTLAGLTPQEHAAIRQEVEAIVAAEAVSRRARFRSAIDRLEAAGRSALKFATTKATARHHAVDLGQARAAQKAAQEALG